MYKCGCVSLHTETVSVCLMLSLQREPVYPADHGSHAAVVIGISFVLDWHLSLLYTRHIQACSVDTVCGYCNIRHVLFLLCQLALFGYPD
jgi:hypothetical protein